MLDKLYKEAFGFGEKWSVRQLQVNPSGICPHPCEICMGSSSPCLVSIVSSEQHLQWSLWNRGVSFFFFLNRGVSYVCSMLVRVCSMEQTCKEKFMDIQILLQNKLEQIK